MSNVNNLESGKIIQLAKCLPCEHENLPLDFQALSKGPGVVIHNFNPSARGVKMRGCLALPGEELQVH